MKAKDLFSQARKKFSADFLQSVKDGDAGKMADAIAEFSLQLQEASDANGSRAAPAAKEVRVLTS